MSRRPPPPADGGGGSPRGVVLLVVALLLGVFLLNKTQVDTSSATGSVRTATPSATTTPTTKAGKATTTTGPGVTTRPVRQPADVKVLPANGSGVAGLGSRVGERLRAKGYNALAPANTAKDVTASVVEYAADFEQEAKLVAEALGLPATAVKPLEASPPVADTKGADVVVLIGPDLETAGATTTTRK